MMTGVYRQLGSAAIAGQPGIRLYNDLMLTAVSKSMTFFSAIIILRGQILPKRSSEINIKQLRTAADAQNRFFKRNRRVKNGPLPRITLFIYFTELIGRFLSITGWINILTAAKHYSITRRDHFQYLIFIIGIC